VEDEEPDERDPEEVYVEEHEFEVDDEPEKPDCIRRDKSDPNWHWGDPTCVVPEEESPEDGVRPDRPDLPPDFVDPYIPSDTPTILPDHNSQNNDHSNETHHFNWKHLPDYYDFFVHTLKLDERVPRNTTAKEALFGLTEGLLMF